MRYCVLSMHQLSNSPLFGTCFCFYVCGTCGSGRTCTSIFSLPLASHWIWLPSEASPSLHNMPCYDKTRPFFLDRNRVPGSRLGVVCTWKLSIMDQCWPFHAQAMPTPRQICVSTAEFTLAQFQVNWLQHLSPLCMLQNAHKRNIFRASTSWGWILPKRDDGVSSSINRCSANYWQTCWPARRAE